MTLFVLRYEIEGEGEQIIGDTLGELDQLKIFFSLSQAGFPPYENYRYFSPASFYGRIQFFDGEAVINSTDISFTSQRLYARDSCCASSFEDRCRKYVCLAQKIDWIGKAFQLQFPNSQILLGNYPQSSDAANYGEVLYRDSPTSFAWQLEPGIKGFVEITGDAPAATVCSPVAGGIPGPVGCRTIGDRPPAPGTCTPSVPGPGGGS